MPTRHVDLTEHHEHFIDQQVAAGKFENASEVLRAGLRLLEQQQEADEQKLNLLRKLASDGFDALDRGQGITFASDEELTDFISRIGYRAARTVV